MQNLLQSSERWISKQTSKASRLMKLAMANPSMISSSQDTDSRFLRRGGRCLAPGKLGLHSPPLARSRESPLQSSWSEAEDGDEALCSARSALLRRRSRSRCERERRLCLKPPLRLGPSISMSVQRHFLKNTLVRPGRLYNCYWIKTNASRTSALDLRCNVNCGLRFLSYNLIVQWKLYGASTLQSEFSHVWASPGPFYPITQRLWKLLDNPLTVFLSRHCHFHLGKEKRRNYPWVAQSAF